MSNRLLVTDDFIPPIFKELATQYRKRFFCQVLGWGCLGALVIALIFLWTVKHLHPQLNYSFLLSALLAPLAAGLIFFFSPLPWKVMIEEADRNLGLKEKLTTLAEYYQSEPDNPFLPSIESTLTAELGDLSAKRVFPLRKTPFLLIAICAVGLVVLAFLPGPSPSVPSPGDPAPEAPVAMAETPGSKETSSPDTSPESDPQAAEDPSRSQPLPAPDGISALNLPDLRSQLDNAQDQSPRQPEPSSDPRGTGDPSSTETTLDAQPKEGQEQSEQQEEAVAGSNRPDTSSGSSLASSKPEAGEESGGQNGLGQNESNPEDNSPSSSGATRRSTTPFQEETGGFEPVMEYNPLQTSSQVSKDSYLSSYLEELYPPEPGLPPGDEQFRERLDKHRAQVLATYGNEEIPLAYRDLIREYFSLLTEE